MGGKKLFFKSWLKIELKVRVKIKQESTYYNDNFFFLGEKYLSGHVL